MTDKKQTKQRLLALCILVVLDIATIGIAFAIGRDPAVTTIIGSFASILVAVLVGKLFKVNDTLYYSMLVFVFLASPMGSVINLYRTFGPYDKIVHLISGFLLAAFGMMLAEFLVGRFTDIKDKTIIFIPLLFAAVMFSSGCAGIWEIFEFTADKLAGGEMQRGMVDTITDMIAGNVGAIAYGIYMLLKQKKLYK